MLRNIKQNVSHHSTIQYYTDFTVGEGANGGDGNSYDPNLVSAPREKSLGTFKSMNKAGLSNPLFEQDKLDELVMETFRPVRLLPI